MVPTCSFLCGQAGVNIQNAQEELQQVNECAIRPGTCTRKHDSETAQQRLQHLVHADDVRWTASRTRNRELELIVRRLFVANYGFPFFKYWLSMIY